MQYHEMNANYAIYKDGWKASFPHGNNTAYGGRVLPESDLKVQLYNVREDFNELHNLADQYPDKVKELAEVFEAEAWKYNVYPLKDRVWGIPKNQNIFNGKDKVTLYANAYLAPFSIPRFVNVNSYAVSADVELQSGKEQGVLLSSGGYLAGFSLYVKGGKLAFAYNSEGKTVELISGHPLGKGKHILKAEIHQNADSRDKLINLYINDKKVAVRQFEGGSARHATETLDVGSDAGTAVTAAYKAPFNFTGTINRVTLENLSY